MKTVSSEFKEMVMMGEFNLNTHKINDKEYV